MIALGNQVSDPRGSGFTLAIGMLYLLAGSLLAIWQGPSLLVLHAFAAFIAMSIVAASNQLVPVLTNARPFAASVTLGLASPFAIGFLLLLLGFAGAPTFAAAAILLVAGAIVWAIVTVWRVISAPLEGQTRAAIGAAAATFAVAASIGGSMALALANRFGSSVLELAPSHGFLMIVGFATVMVVVVSYRFVPMFALAHTTEHRLTRLAQWVLLTAGWLAAVVASSTILRSVAIVIALGALIGAVRVHGRNLRARLRKKLDISLRYAAVAWICVFGATLLALAATWRPELWRSAVALAVGGWLTISILGYAYKIVGFLAWEYCRRRWPTLALPPLSDAVPPRPANIVLSFLAIGVAGIAVDVTVSPTIGAGPADHLAFSIYAIGVFGSAGLLIRLVRSYVIAPSLEHRARNRHGQRARPPTNASSTSS